MNPSWRKNYIRYKLFFLNSLKLYRSRPDLKTFMEIFLSLATVSIFAVFALRPTLITISKLVKEIEGKQDTLTIMNAKIENLKLARNYYDQNKDFINLVYESVPLEPNPNILLRQLEKIAQDSLLQLSSYQNGEVVLLGDSASPPETETQPQSNQSLAFNLEVQGNYPALLNLLKQIEQMRRPVRTQLFSVSANTSTTIEGEARGQLLLGISADVPYLSKTLVP